MTSFTEIVGTLGGCDTLDAECIALDMRIVFFWMMRFYMLACVVLHIKMLMSAYARTLSVVPTLQHGQGVYTFTAAGRTGALLEIGETTASKYYKVHDVICPAIIAGDTDAILEDPTQFAQAWKPRRHGRAMCTCTTDIIAGLTLAMNQPLTVVEEDGITPIAKLAYVEAANTSLTDNLIRSDYDFSAYTPERQEALKILVEELKSSSPKHALKGYISESYDACVFACTAIVFKLPMYFSQNSITTTVAYHYASCFALLCLFFTSRKIAYLLILSAFLAMQLSNPQPIHTAISVTVAMLPVLWTYKRWMSAMIQHQIAQNVVKITNMLIFLTQLPGVLAIDIPSMMCCGSAFIIMLTMVFLGFCYRKAPWWVHFTLLVMLSLFSFAISLLDRINRGWSISNVVGISLSILSGFFAGLSFLFVRKTILREYRRDKHVVGAFTKMDHRLTHNLVSIFFRAAQAHKIALPLLITAIICSYMMVGSALHAGMTVTRGLPDPRSVHNIRLSATVDMRPYFDKMDEFLKTLDQLRSGPFYAYSTARLAVNYNSATSTLHSSLANCTLSELTFVHGSYYPALRNPSNVASGICLSCKSMWTISVSIMEAVSLSVSLPTVWNSTIIETIDRTAFHARYRRALEEHAAAGEPAAEHVHDKDESWVHSTLHQIHEHAHSIYKRFIDLIVGFTGHFPCNSCVSSTDFLRYKDVVNNRFNAVEMKLEALVDLQRIQNLNLKTQVNDLYNRTDMIKRDMEALMLGNVVGSMEKMRLDAALRSIGTIANVVAEMLQIPSRGVNPILLYYNPITVLQQLDEQMGVYADNNRMVLLSQKRQWGGRMEGMSLVIWSEYSFSSSSELVPWTLVSLVHAMAENHGEACKAYVAKYSENWFYSSDYKHIWDGMLDSLATLYCIDGPCSIRSAGWRDVTPEEVNFLEQLPNISGVYEIPVKRGKVDTSCDVEFLDAFIMEDIGLFSFVTTKPATLQFQAWESIRSVDVNFPAGLWTWRAPSAGRVTVSCGIARRSYNIMPGAIIAIPHVPTNNDFTLPAFNESIMSFTPYTRVVVDAEGESLAQNKLNNADIFLRNMISAYSNFTISASGSGGSFDLGSMFKGMGEGVGAILKGGGEGVGAAVKGTGEGIGAAAKGVGEGVGAVASGLGDAAFGIAIAIGVIGVVGIGGFILWKKFSKEKKPEETKGSAHDLDSLADKALREKSHAEQKANDSPLNQIADTALDMHPLARVVVG